MTLQELGKVLGQTVITLPVDLNSVARLVDGEDFSLMADGGLEVYIVDRSTVTPRIYAFAIDGDWLRLVVGDKP